MYFRKVIAVLLLALMPVLFSGCSSSPGITQEDYDAIVTEKDTLQKEYDSIVTEKEKLQKEYNEYKEKMKVYEEMTEAEALEAKAKAEAEVARIEEEAAAKKAAEEAAKAEAEAAAAAAKAEEEAAAAAAKAEEEAKGYETGITYDQLARTPDDYEGKKVKFYGRVVQVMEGDGEVQIRLAVNDDYDTIIFGAYESSLVSSRVLEDDMITVYGVSMGLLTYESTMGGNITIPSMLIEKIDQ